MSGWPETDYYHKAIMLKVEDSSFISVQETSSTIEDKLVSRGFSENGIKAYM
jgi:uncharacterized protein (DUF302 family)